MIRFIFFYRYWRRDQNGAFETTELILRDVLCDGNERFVLFKAEIAGELNIGQTQLSFWIRNGYVSDTKKTSDFFDGLNDIKVEVRIFLRSGQNFQHPPDNVERPHRMGGEDQFDIVPYAPLNVQRPFQPHRNENGNGRNPNNHHHHHDSITPSNLPFDGEHSSFDSSSLFDFNKQLFGIEGSNVGQKLPAENLFQKPKALVVISVKGLENFNYDGRVFNFTANFESERIRESLKQHFGDDMIHAEVNSSGIFGSHFKRDAKSNDVHIESEYEAIKNMDKLADAIRTKDRKNANVVDYYRIHLDVSNARTEIETKQLEEDIKKTIDTVVKAFNKNGSETANVEIYTHEEPVDGAEYKRIKAFQKKYQVSQARHIDYPATSAIMMREDLFSERSDIMAYKQAKDEEQRRRREANLEVDTDTHVGLWLLCHPDNDAATALFNTMIRLTEELDLDVTHDDVVAWLGTAIRCHPSNLIPRGEALTIRDKATLPTDPRGGDWNTGVGITQICLLMQYLTKCSLNRMFIDERANVLFAVLRIFSDSDEVADSPHAHQFVRHLYAVGAALRTELIDALASIFFQLSNDIATMADGVRAMWKITEDEPLVMRLTVEILMCLCQRSEVVTNLPDFKMGDQMYCKQVKMIILDLTSDAHEQVPELHQKDELSNLVNEVFNLKRSN